jgi:hypothetical protein
VWKQQVESSSLSGLALVVITIGGTDSQENGNSSQLSRRKEKTHFAEKCKLN